MMRQMRENTKWIMLITAAAFVALMVFEWGMDASGQSGGAGNVGSVGGTNVPVQDYQTIYRNLYDQVQRTQDAPISSQQDREIEDMAWNEVVDQILIQKELDRRGIRVTDDEIRQAVRTAPPPGLRDDPNFQTDGQFDMDLYQQWLSQAAQDPQFLSDLERYYRDMIPRNKLLRQLTSGVYLSDRQLWEEWRDRNEEATVSFIALRAQEHVPDSEVEVTREEIEAYYNENRDEFSIPATAGIRYAYLPKAATAQDSVAQVERAEQIRADLEDGVLFEDLADLESDDRSTGPQGGMLEPFTRGDGQWPEEFEEVAFSIPVGEVSEPFQTEYGLHILEILSRDGDQVEEARHILVEMGRTDDSEIRLLMRADSLEALGRNLTVDEAADQLGISSRDGRITEDYAILPGVGQADEAQDWIFDEQEGIGAVSPVFENREAFYMVEIRNLTRAGYMTLDNVAPQIENRLRLQKKLDRAHADAQAVASELRDGASMEEVAERLGVEVETVGPFARTDFVPGLGTRNAAVGAVFGTAEGEITSPVRIGERVLVIRVEERVEADREAWEAQKAMQRAQRTAEVRQERLELWLDGLREITRIQDTRAEYFRMAEDQADQPQIPMAF